MSAATQSHEVSVLRLTLHDRLVGYLVGFKDGRNALIFADEFRDDRARPTFSLITHSDFPNAQLILEKPWMKHHKLHPTLSNVLPEGALRELIAQGLKVHLDNEFQMLAYLGQDLPGAIVAGAIEPEEVPHRVLATYGATKAKKAAGANDVSRFSLAGVQMKFSMREKDGRYNLARYGELGNWIIKTPSTRHPFVPLNEFTTMSLAAIAGGHPLARHQAASQRGDRERALTMAEGPARSPDGGVAKGEAEQPLEQAPERFQNSLVARGLKEQGEVASVSGC